MAAPRLLVGALTLATLTSLVACSGDTGPEEDPTSSAPSPSASEPPAVSGPLEVVVAGTGTRVKAYEQLAAAYQSQNPDVELTFRSVPTADELAEPLLAEVVESPSAEPEPESAQPSPSGSASAPTDGGPDVFLADVDHLAQLVEAGRLRPVDTLLEEEGLQFGDDYQRAALNAFSANDRLQCMPAEISPLVVYYNKALLEAFATTAEGESTEADPDSDSEPEPEPEPEPDSGDGSEEEQPWELPTEERASWTWEDFVAAATAVAEAPGPAKGGWIPADVETLTAFVRSAGGEIVDDLVTPTSLSLTSDEARTALENLVEFAREPALAPTPEELEQRSADERFLAGQLGFYVGYREELPRLRAAEGLEFDVLPLPSMGRFQAVSRMGGWCVNAESVEVPAATDFIAFAVSQEGFEIVAGSGAVVPSGLDVVHDEAFTQPTEQPANAHVWPTSIRRSEPMPYAIAWPAVAATVDATLQRLITTPGLDLEATVEPLMEQLNEQSVQLFTPPEEPELEPSESPSASPTD